MKTLFLLTLVLVGCGSSQFHSIRNASEVKAGERILVGEVRVEGGDLAQWVSGVYLGSVVVMNDESVAAEGASPWWATTVGTDVEDDRFSRSGGPFVVAAPRTRVFLIGVRVYANAVIGTSRLLLTPVEIPASGSSCAYIGTIVLRPEGESFAVDLKDEFELFRQRSAKLPGCRLERALGRLHGPGAEAVQSLSEREPIRLNVEDRGESYYGIRGESASELISAMEQKRVTSHSVGHGTTNWKLVPELTCARYPDGFRIRSGNVRLEIDIVYPKWENADEGSPSLQRQWQRMLEMMHRHEDGHRRNAMAAGEALQKALELLEPAPSCEAVTQRVNATVERVAQECSEKDRRYDQETDHGKKQGVMLRETR